MTLVLLGVSAGHTQTAANADNPKPVGVDWEEINLPGFTFSAPKGLKKVEKRCFESCYYFESELFKLHIDAFDPGVPSDAQQTSIWIDKDRGIYAVMWFLEALEQRYQYQTGAVYIFQRRKTSRVGFYIYSNTNIKQTAEKILTSVKFSDEMALPKTVK